VLCFCIFCNVFRFCIVYRVLRVCTVYCVFVLRIVCLYFVLCVMFLYFVMCYVFVLCICIVQSVFLLQQLTAQLTIGRCVSQAASLKLENFDSNNFYCVCECKTYGMANTNR
jgi:hypothetical protein